jgi:hypothetical protein
MSSSGWERRESVAGELVDFKKPLLPAGVKNI